MNRTGLAHIRQLLGDIPGYHQPFQVSQTQAGQLVCFIVFMFDVEKIFHAWLIPVIGKRPVYPLTILGLCMMDVWSSLATSCTKLPAACNCSRLPAVPAVGAGMCLCDKSRSLRDDFLLGRINGIEGTRVNFNIALHRFFWN